ncbi:hypothetical protein A3K73_03015 [Candidatus Pacearchaeota archaeon RBG_13_36_9]|nr:MAG: hypothetical protein A3K73_03015 [Candidatus Pacearchaeota archaeon RBG_13_36_9]
MEMPISETYEQELIYMPYRKSLERVTQIICSQVPRLGRVLDLMCGTGDLLRGITFLRRSLHLQGVDIDQEYIKHARQKCPEVEFEVGDVLEWNPREKYDAVLCTGDLHHIPYERQEEMIGRMASMVKPEGFVLISDCYIDDYSNELERKLAAAKLGYEYLISTIKNGAPDDVVAATADILKNDIMMHEFKTSLKKRMPAFKGHFKTVEVEKTWPKEETEYGDYIAVLKNKYAATANRTEVFSLSTF